MAISAAQAEAEILERRNIVQRVRRSMRDFPELNTLIDGVENSDELILDELEVVIEEINAVPPPIGFFGAGNIPMSFLIDGTIARLLDAACILLVRNMLNFSAGGVSVQFTQPTAYLQLAAERRRRYEEQRDRWKVAINHQMAIDGTGGVFSDWIVVSRPTRFFYRDALRGVPYFGV